MSRYLEKLTDDNSIVIKVVLPEGTTCFHIGRTLEEVCDSLGCDVPLLEETLLLLAKDVYHPLKVKVSRVSVKEVVDAAKKVQDSNNQVFIY